MNNAIKLNVVRIITVSPQSLSPQFKGEAYCEGTLVAETKKMLSRGNCIKSLNKKINQFNTLNHKHIPLMKADGKEIHYGVSKKPAKTSSQAVSSSEYFAEKAPSNDVEKQEITLEKPVVTAKKPPRKPFTPYGLNGYFVDKKGNVRLMLDRRANARTIVLDPVMFQAIAEMVQRTQEQQNANA